MEKLAVCCINRKGGVGKTTASIIMAQTAAERGMRVLCIDVDDQKNFFDAMDLVRDKYNFKVKPEIKDRLDKGDADLNFDLFVIDCPVALDRVTETAISFADIVLVPTLGDLFSISNLPVVYDFVVAKGKYPAQVAVIKNSFGTTRTVKNIEQILSNKQYPIAGRWPRNEHIINNIIEGRPWWSGMDARQQQPFLTFYSKVWTAWKRLLANDLETTWKMA